MTNSAKAKQINKIKLKFEKSQATRLTSEFFFIRLMFYICDYRTKKIIIDNHMYVPYNK